MNDDNSRNISDTPPKEGTRVDLRDPEFIWSAASIISVAKDSNYDLTNFAADKLQTKYKVTLRYDGWGAHWDETLPWPHPRVSTLFTYTKQVKCLASVIGPFSPNRSGPLTLWPCKVQFRMPHPGKKCAEKLLRQEMNVFVQPFGKKLPKKLTLSMQNGGQWINRSQLRHWNKERLGLPLPKEFEEAWRLGADDISTVGDLPSKPFESGTLLRDVYRIRITKGIPSKRDKLSGGLHADPTSPPFEKRQVFVNCIKISGKKKKTKNRDHVSSEEEKQTELKPLSFQPPPALPTPVKIIEPFHSGIARFDKINKWGAKIEIHGNDVFVGSFPTQSQAVIVRKMACAYHCHKTKDRYIKGEIHTSDLIPNGKKAMLMDAKSVDTEACIFAFEKAWKSENNFSLHDWTMQQIRHDDYCHEIEIQNNKEDRKKRKMTTLDCSHSIRDQPTKTVLKRRKQGHPRRADLSRMIYIP